MNKRAVYYIGLANGYEAVLQVKPGIGDTELETWFERDRAHVELREKGNGATIIGWWDDAVHEAVEDGFLVMGRGDRALHESAFDYAVQLGLFPTEGIFTEAAFEFEEHEREYADPGSEEAKLIATVNASPQRKELWTAYGQGVAAGIKKGIKEHLKKGKR